MPKFEYKATPSLGTDMNAMGEEGWELAGVENASMHWKRPLENNDTIHHQIHQTLKDMHSHMTANAGQHQGHQGSQNPRDAQGAQANPGSQGHAEHGDHADHGGNKAQGSNQPVTQPADRPIGKTEPGPRPESTARTAATAGAGSGGTAEAVPSGHTPPRRT